MSTLQRVANRPTWLLGRANARSQALLEWVRRRDAWFVPMTGTLIDGRIEAAYPAIHAIEPRYYGNYQSFLN